MASLRNKQTLFRLLTIVTIVCSVLILFTRFYSIGYIILVLTTASHISALKAFGSYLSRIVLGGLVLASSVMLVGLVVWLLGTTVHPLYVGILYLLLVLFISYVKRPSKNDLSFTLIDKSDLLSIGLALIAPLIVLISFGASAPAMLQIANEGWDNGSHVRMIEGTSIYNSYLYGNDKETIKKALTYGGSAYPQAWHLATANILDGFGSPHAFNPNKPIRTTYVYVGAVLLWLVIASYVFTKVSLHVGRKFLKRRLTSAPEYITFVAANLLIQSIVLWGSFSSGFSNYIAMLAYVVVMVAAIVDKRNDDTRRNRIALLFGVAASLCWFLPIPAIFIALFAMTLWGIRFTKPKHLIKPSNLSAMLLYFLGILVCLLQVFIFVHYSDTSGGDQLNEGVAIDAYGYVNGVFPVSQILFVGVVAFTIWHLVVKAKKNLKLALLATMPFVGFVIAMYIYQQVSNGYSSYYLPKSMGIALIALGPFFISSFVYWVHDTFSGKYKVRGIVSTSIGLGILGIFILLGNQSLYGVSHLLEKNTRVNNSTEAVVADFLKNSNPDKDMIVVLRGDPSKPYEDRNGRFEMRVTYRKLNCAYTIRAPDMTMEEWVERLGNCAKRLQKWGDTITVVTSEKTTKLVEELKRPNIKIIEVPLAKKI